MNFDFKINNLRFFKITHWQLRRQLLYPDELQADDLKNKPWYLRKVAGFIGCFGAGDMNRTRDLLITNELLYRLSYTGDKQKL